jgi:hypothetical protein
MSEFIQVTIPAWLRGSKLRSNVQQWRAELLTALGKILDVQSTFSVRERFYRSGTALGSLRRQIVDDGDRQSYEEFSELFYFRFGEFGTGRRGAESNVRHPADYEYGQKPGMAARFMLGHALEDSKEEVFSELRQFLRQIPSRVTS